jgi:hypothetical protein
LISRDLFLTYHDLAPRFGKRIHTVLGGDVFECGRSELPGSGCAVDVWVSPTEVIVAYAPFRVSEKDPGDVGLKELEGLIHELRRSAPLPLGKVRDGSSYGARMERDEGSPVIKWAQYGDWAGLARGWYLGWKKGESCGV